MKMPVHCCCEPAKRLGYLEMPDGFDWPRDIVIRRSGEIGAPLDSSLPDRRVEEIRTEIQWITSASGPYLAVKSAHLPIEEWRKVPGFTEEL